MKRKGGRKPKPEGEKYGVTAYSLPPQILGEIESEAIATKKSRSAVVAIALSQYFATSKAA